MIGLILYTSVDGKNQIKLRDKDQTVWLSQREMAELFDVSTNNVGLHLKNIYGDGELSRYATTEETSVVQAEGIFFDRDAFLDCNEFSLPEIFGRAPKDANGAIAA